MIRNIKDGLSHARKDKIKIQYEIEFKKLINLSDDLIDQFLCIKWERGKNEHGSTRDIRVVDGHIENFHNAANLTDNDLSYSQIPPRNSTGYRNSLSSKDSNIGIGNTQTSGTSSSNTPYIELDKMPKTLTRKQSKLLLGNKIDGTNNMSGGDGIAIVPQEKITLKVHLFSNTIHSKSDHILNTNYEQKLFNIYIHHGSNILCHTSIDLSLYTEENTNNAVIVPFPSSSLSQPTLYMNIKSTYLKYNDKPIIKTSKDIISKKELGSLVPNGANRLIEYQGEVYFIKNNKNNSSSNNSGISSSISNSSINSEISKEENYQNSSKESNSKDKDKIINNNSNSSKDKILRFDLENNIKHSPPTIITTEVDSNSSYSTNNNIINNNSNNNSTMDTNNSFDNEKNSSQSTWDEFTEEDHLKNSISEIHHNKIICQKNEEIKELNDKIKQLQNDIGDQKRLSTSLQTLIDDCRVKVLEYEEHYHRAQSLENYAKRLLNIERLEHQEKLTNLKNQIKQLQQQLQQQQQSANLSSSSIPSIIINDTNKELVNSKQQLSPNSNSEISTYSNSGCNSSNESSPKEDIRLIEKDIQLKKEIEKNENLANELNEKLKEIKSLESDNNNIQTLFTKCAKEKDNLELLNDELSNKVKELRLNIEKITKSQIQEDLKRENELRKRKNTYLLSPNQENLLNSSSGSNNNAGFVNIIKSMLTQSYPTIFHNPLIAWFLVILCFLMFIFKSIEC